MEHGPSNVIGLRVRELREKQGLTQEQLTARCQVLGLNITRTALARIETRRRGVADYEAHLLAEALRVPINDLFSARAIPILRRHQNPRGAPVKRRKSPTSKRRPK